MPLHITTECCVAERKHRHLLEVSRSLKIQNDLPDIFWGDSVLTVCYIINFLPSFVLNFVSPYERLYGTAPKIEHLRVLGCLCYGRNLTQQNKFDIRSFPSVF